MLKALDALSGTALEVATMLMRTDPFRDLDRDLDRDIDRLTGRVLGNGARPGMMHMDAWREGDAFVVEFDLPGVDQNAIQLQVDRNVLTVRAERPQPDQQLIAAERPRGVFTRQLFLGDSLDTERIEASYDQGVLRLTIPVAEEAKPRRITVTKKE